MASLFRAGQKTDEAAAIRVASSVDAALIDAVVAFYAIYEIIGEFQVIDTWFCIRWALPRFL